MTTRTPLVLVTRGRLDMLAATLGSLYSSLAGHSASYAVYHVWQDDVSPYDESYALKQIREAFRALSGIMWVDFHMTGAVAACRAEAIRRALNRCGDVTDVVMFDGDVLFHNDPIRTALRGNKGVTGWTHLDVANDRGFADYFDGILYSPEDYLQRFGHLPHCQHPSPFHRYARTADIHHVSTHAAWAVDALIAKGKDGQSVLDVWASWPPGVRSYDVAGCVRIAELGYPVRILECGHLTINLYVKPDSAEGYWVSDAIHPDKVT